MVHVIISDKRSFGNGIGIIDECIVMLIVVFRGAFF